MRPGFEQFEHTADLGTRVWAASQTELIAPATVGFYACIGDVIPGAALADQTIDITGDDPAYLLHDYLSELLARFESGQRVAIPQLVEHYDETGLVVAVRWHALDEQRSAPHREVKAITYHELSVARTPDGWEAVFIVDI